MGEAVEGADEGTSTGAAVTKVGKRVGVLDFDGATLGFMEGWYEVGMELGLDDG